jgi:hypothetical protein
MRGLKRADECEQISWRLMDPRSKGASLKRWPELKGPVLVVVVRLMLLKTSDVTAGRVSCAGAFFGLAVFSFSV